MSEMFCTDETFRKQFSAGRVGEKRVARSLLDFGWKVWIDSAGSSHDLLVQVDRRRIRVEVKNEDNFSDSGNILVEFSQNRGKPSGIDKSKADIWVHTLGKMAVAFVADPMKRYLKTVDLVFPTFHFKRSDNDNWGKKIKIFVLSIHDWADYLEIDDLPLSRVWTWGRF